jgi:hypothetical protein
MTDARGAWTDVADRLSALGATLRTRAEDELSERDQDETEDAWARVRSAIEEVADALGDAARDPAVRADVRELTDAFVAAAKVSADEVRKAVSKRS